MATTLTDNGCRTCAGSTGQTVADHVLDADPHPQYQTAAEVSAQITAEESADAVDSVNTQTGAVVLDTDDIAEAANLYYTDERAQDAVGTMADANTLNYVDATPLLEVKNQLSITDDASGIMLDGDAATPGNDRYYGTNAVGAKGFHVLPGGSGAIAAPDLDENFMDYEVAPHPGDRYQSDLRAGDGAAPSTFTTTFSVRGIAFPQFAWNVNEYGAKPRTASFYGMQRAFRMNTAGGTADDEAGLSFADAGSWARGAAAAPAYGGFYYSQFFGIADSTLVALASMSVGLHNTADIFDASTNFGRPTKSGMSGVLMGHDESDTTMRIFHGDGVGAPTEIDLGANFPVAATTDWYQFELFCAPGGNVFYKATRHNTGDVATGELTTDLPTVSTLLGFVAVRDTGNEATNAVQIDIGDMVVLEGPPANVLV